MDPITKKLVQTIYTILENETPPTEPSWVPIHSSASGASPQMRQGYQLDTMYKMLGDLGIKSNDNVNTAINAITGAKPESGTQAFSVGGRKLYVEYGTDSAGRHAAMRFRVDPAAPPATPAAAPAKPATPPPPPPVAPKVAATTGRAAEMPKPGVLANSPWAKAATTGRAAEMPKPGVLANSPWAKGGGKVARALGPLGLALGVVGLATGQAKADDVAHGLNPLSILDSGSLGTDDVPAEVQGQSMFTEPKPKPKPEAGPADDFVFGPPGTSRPALQSGPPTPSSVSSPNHNKNK